jgi:hypothetical protein
MLYQFSSNCTACNADLVNYSRDTSFRPPKLCTSCAATGATPSKAHWQWISMVPDGSNTPTAVADPKPAEINCRQCGKKNDAGVKKCWLCECPEPG